MTKRKSRVTNTVQPHTDLSEAKFSQEELSLNFSSILKVTGCLIQAEVVDNKSGRLMINGNMIAKVGINIVANFIANDMSINLLDLDLSTTKQKDLGKLGVAIKANQSIRDLTLNAYNLKWPHELNCLSQDIGDNRSINKLKYRNVLVCNKETSTAVKMLITILENSRQLLHLDISHTELTNRTMKHLYPALRKAKTLTSLDLSDNFLGAAGIGKVKDVLGSNKALIKVSVQGNPILKKIYLSPFLEALKHNNDLINELSIYLVEKFITNKIKVSGIDYNTCGKLKFYQVSDSKSLKENSKKLVDNQEARYNQMMSEVNNFINQNFLELCGVCKDLSSQQNSPLAMVSKTIFPYIASFIGDRVLWQIKRGDTQEEYFKKNSFDENGLIYFNEADLLTLSENPFIFDPPFDVQGA